MDSPMWGDSPRFDSYEREFTNNTTDNIGVYLRIRPRTPAEHGADEALGQVSISSPKCCEIYHCSRPGRYYFDHIFGETSQQEQVFNSTIKPLVHSLIQGNNVLLFAYGVTNSGKTYTIHGADGVQTEGILPRIFRSGFRMLEVLQDPDAPRGAILEEFESQEAYEAMRRSHDPAATYCIVISALEIYNEKLVDLLDSRVKDLKMGEEGGEMVVRGLLEIEVKSPAEALNHVKAARSRIQMAQTNCNADSSRSHSAFMVHLCRKSGVCGIIDVVGKLTVCDLAGSERAHRTENTGARLKEASNINQSLVVLGRCLQVLRQNQSRSPTQRMVVPYRESKLTRLFQAPLSGSGKVVMIVNVSPCARDLEETAHVLQYSSIAREVVNTPTHGGAKRKMQLGEGPPMTLQRALKEIQALTAQLTDAQAAVTNRETEVRQEMSQKWVQSLQSLQFGMQQQQDRSEAAIVKFSDVRLRACEEHFRKQLESISGMTPGNMTLNPDCTMVDSETERPTEQWRANRQHELERTIEQLHAELVAERALRAQAESRAAPGRGDGVPQNRLEELTCEVTQLRSTLFELQTANLELQSEVASLKGLASAKASPAGSPCTSPRATRDTLRKRIADLELQLAKETAIQADHLQTIQTLHATNTKISNTIEHQKNTVEGQRKELYEAQLQNDLLAQQVAALSAANDGLQAMLRGEASRPHRRPTRTASTDTADLHPTAPPRPRTTSPPSYHLATGLRSPSHAASRAPSTLRSAAAHQQVHMFQSPRRQSPTGLPRFGALRPGSPTPDPRPVNRSIPQSRPGSVADRPRSQERRPISPADSHTRSRAGTPSEDLRSVSSASRRVTPTSRVTPPPPHFRLESPEGAPRKAKAGSAMRTRARSKASPLTRLSEEVVAGSEECHRAGRKRTSDQMQLDTESEKSRRRNMSRTKTAPRR